MVYEENYLEIIRENSTFEKYNNLLVAMESEGGKISVIQSVLNSIIKQITSRIGKMMKGNQEYDVIYGSNGDIIKVPNIENTLAVLKTLKKSKNSKIKSRANALETLYNNIAIRKVAYMKLRDKGRAGSVADPDTAMANVFYWAFYVSQVKLFITGVSILAYDAIIAETKPNPRTNNVDGMVERSNKIFSGGDVDKSINYVVMDKKVQEEAAVLVITAALMFSILTVCFSIRMLVFYFYNTRMRIADYFEQQSAFLNIHQTELKNNKDILASDKSDILKAQKAWADRFMTLSELFVVDDIKATQKAEKEIKVVNKEINTDTIDVPNTGMQFF